MINTTYLPPFKRMCVTIGNLPTSFMESMSYYEALQWLYNYLDKEVIPAINTEGEAITELQAAMITLKDYVDNYFENLDIQTEIDNKLDEMAESGELADIIAQYLELAGVLAYDTKADMKNAENLSNGSICKTLGDTAYNDGFGNFYKIRTLTSGDTIDDDNIVALANNNTLIAEKIPNGEVLEILNDCFYKEITYSVHREYDSDYYLTTIPKYDTDGNQIDLYIDTVEGTTTYTPSSYARKHLTSFTCNATLAIKDTADEQYHDTLVIANGEIINPVYNFTTPLETYYQYLCIDADRNWSSYQASITSPQTLISAGVKQAWLVWCQIIGNGEFIDRDIPLYDLTNGIHQIIGVKENGDVIILTSDGRSSASHGFSVSDAATILLSQGVVNAWELDGGGSTSTCVKTYRINRYHDEELTKERNIRYVLSAKKQANYKNVGEAYAIASEQLSLLNKQIMGYINAHNSFYQLTLIDTTISSSDAETLHFSKGQSYNVTNVHMANLSDSSELIIDKDGFYTFIGEIDGIFATAGVKYFAIYSNGTQRVTSRYTATTDSSIVRPFVTTLTLTAGDRVTFVHQGATGDRVHRGRIIVKYYGT